MSHVLIKMCGITRPQDACKAIEEGADLIGMIFSLASPRYVSLEQAEAISTVAREAGAKTVGVFYENTLDHMRAIIKAVQLDFAQLHSPEATLLGARLDIPKIYVRQPGMGIESLPDFSESEDWILYDAAVGGSGKLIDWTKIKVPEGIRWFLAGGLTPSNVMQAIEQLNPTGVDVASGIEGGNKGIKDPELIKQFAEAVRYAETRRTI